MNVKSTQRLFPSAPVGAEVGDAVHFIANKHWYDFLFKKRRNRPHRLGLAIVGEIDPVSKQIWFNKPIPENVLPGDYMIVESNPTV